MCDFIRFGRIWLFLNKIICDFQALFMLFRVGEQNILPVLVIMLLRSGYSFLGIVFTYWNIVIV